MEDKQLFYVDELNGAYITYGTLYEILQGVHKMEYTPPIPFLKLLMLVTPEFRQGHTDSDVTWTRLIHFIQRSSALVALRTSGVTPKTIIHNMDTLLRGIEQEDHPRWAITSSAYHIVGVWSMFQTLFNHGTLINVFQRSRGYVLNQLRHHNVTHICAAPSFYRMLKTDTVFQSIRKVIVTGEVVSEGLLNDLKKMFPNARMLNVYFTTETGILLSSEGELFRVPRHLQEWVRVKSQRLQVHKRLTGERALTEEEWFDTGDIVHQDSSAECFSVVGKDEFMVKVKGCLINILQLEAQLRAVEGIHEVVISPRINLAVGEVLVVKVVIQPESGLTEEGIKKILKCFLPEGASVIVRIIPELRWDDVGRACRE